MINIVKTENVSKQTYPKLMTLVENGGVFIFLSDRDAFCLDPGNSDNWVAGEYFKSTGIIAFVNYNEPITIQNA